MSQLVRSMLTCQLMLVGNELSFGVMYTYTLGIGPYIDRVEVNINNPEYCHTKSNMKPSMKPGITTMTGYSWDGLDLMLPFSVQLMNMLQG